MRWLALLLLVGCTPDRVGVGADYVNQNDEYRSGFGEYEDGESASNFISLDSDPYWIGKVWAEWDIKRKAQADLGWLHSHAEMAPSPPPVVTDEEPERGGWEGVTHDVFSLDADKFLMLMIIVGFLAFIFRDRIKKRFFNKKEGE